MSSKVILVFAVILAVISVGAALKCYACSGTSTSDCAKGNNSSMVVLSCGNISHSTFHHALHFNDKKCNYEKTADSSKLQAVCLTAYLTDYQPKMLARGCGVFPARVDPCTFLQKRMHMEGCKSCSTNLCNNQSGEEQDRVTNMNF